MPTGYFGLDNAFAGGRRRLTPEIGCLHPRPLPAEPEVHTRTRGRRDRLAAPQRPGPGPGEHPAGVAPSAQRRAHRDPPDFIGGGTALKAWQPLQPLPFAGEVIETLAAWAVARMRDA